MFVILFNWVSDLKKKFRDIYKVITYHFFYNMKFCKFKCDILKIRIKSMHIILLYTLKYYSLLYSKQSEIAPKIDELDAIPVRFMFL